MDKEKSKDSIELNKQTKYIVAVLDKNNYIGRRGYLCGGGSLILNHYCISDPSTALIFDINDSNDEFAYENLIEKDTEYKYEKVFINTTIINEFKGEKEMKDNDLYFAKVEPNAITPSKRDEDAGYDIYTCETETIVIPPCSTRMIDTGIAIACSKNYFPKFFDKGGMGSKGIIVGAGVGDSGYRDKYFIPLINTNENKYVVITNQSQEEIDEANYFDLEDKLFKKTSEIEHKLFFNTIKFKKDCIIKPLNKAITQFVMLPVPKMNVKEITYEELKNIKSERGLGKLGSSGK